MQMRSTEASDAMRATLQQATEALERVERVHDGAGGDAAPWPVWTGELPDAPLDSAVYTRFLAEQVIATSINMAAPLNLAHMTGAVPALLRPVAEAALAINQNLAKCEGSRSLSRIERQTLATLHRLVFEPNGAAAAPAAPSAHVVHGMFASGGSLANLAALWCARNRCTAVAPGEIARAGLATVTGLNAERLVVIGSTTMHYSIDKAADLLGIGSRQVLRLPTDDDCRADIAALHDLLADCARRRWRPIAIVGVAGSTDCGSIDPLNSLGAAARRHSIHFHVDAAWGSPLLFSARHRPLLRGIEQADSVTLDFHKQLNLPIGLSALMLRDPRDAAIFMREAAYMLRSDSPDLGKHSLEGSRNGLSLVAHAALQLFGRAGIAERIDAKLARAARFAQLIEQHEAFELLLPPQTNIVLYRWWPPQLRNRGQTQPTPADTEWVNACNVRLQTLQYEAGRSHVSRTTLRHLPGYRDSSVVALRAVIANAETSDIDLQSMLDEQCRLALQTNDSAADCSPGGPH